MNTNSEFLHSSVVQILQCQTNTTNDFSSSPSSIDQDFLSPFSSSSTFQTPFFDEGGILSSNSDSLSFSEYDNSEDCFVDVMSSPVSAPLLHLSAQEEEIRRQRLARKAELARANRKRKKQVNDDNIHYSNNSSSFRNLENEGDSDSSLSSFGSRSPSPPCDYSDMSMSPGPQPSNWDGGFEEEDVRRKRLARKAELARVSRKKKKDRIEELEAQLAQMQNELNIARQLSTFSGAISKVEPVCNKQIEQSNHQQHYNPTADISSPPSYVAAAERLNKAMGDFANPNYLGAFYSAFIDKVREDMTQIDQLQTSMQSSLCLRFVQWIMNQNDKFYEDPCGLWYSLFSQELGASPTQLVQLLELRKEFAQKVSISGPDIVSQAFDALRKAMDDSSRLMAVFAQIFSPAQLTLFFQWVERFGPVCIKINL